PGLEVCIAARQPWNERAEGAGVPAIVVDATASVVFEILDVFVFRRLPVGETGSHAHAVDGNLLKAVDDLRGLDAKDVIERRRDIVDLIKLRPRDRIMLDMAGPADDQRVACAPEVGGDQL